MVGEWGLGNVAHIVTRNLSVAEREGVGVQGTSCLQAIVTVLAEGRGVGLTKCSLLYHVPFTYACRSESSSVVVRGSKIGGAEFC